MCWTSNWKIPLKSWIVQEPVKLRWTYATKKKKIKKIQSNTKKPTKNHKQSKTKKPHTKYLILPPEKTQLIPSCAPAFKIIATHKGPPRNEDRPAKGSVHKHLQKLSWSWYKLPAYLCDKCSEQVHIFITEIWNRSVARQTDILI